MNDTQLTVFHDGACPICRLDIDLLKARNGDGRLQFIDISAAAFDASRHGRSLAEFAAEIHAQLPDGRFVTGLEVFRRAYRAVGLGWLLAPTGWGPLQRPADRLYRLFARHRPALGRRFGPLLVTLAAALAARRAGACRTGRCDLPSRAGRCDLPSRD